MRDDRTPPPTARTGRIGERSGRSVNGHPITLASPCIELADPKRRVSWGTVHTRVAITVLAPRDRLVALLLDYTRWSRIFPETIADAALVDRDAHSLVILVHHRREGHVLNVLTDCGNGVVVLREFKRRFNATFVNGFVRTEAGTRYTIDAEVRLKRPFAIVAPVLRGVVERALRRYTMDPLRAAAERDEAR